MQKLSLLPLIILFWCSAAHAYVGPGLGAGTIAVLLGVIISLIFAVIALLYYPIKRKLKARKKLSADNKK